MGTERGGEEWRIDGERSRKERRGEASHHLAGEVMTQHIHLSGSCLLLLLYRGRKLTGRASSAPVLRCDNTTLSQAAGTAVKKCY